MEAETKKSMEQNILEAAEEVFLEKGFSQASTTDIAKKVGCNQALIHYYFRTKEKLFDLIFENKMVLFLEQFLKINSDDVDFQERVKRITESHFDLLVANPNFPKLLVSELLNRPKRLAALGSIFEKRAKRMLQNVQTKIDEEVQRGTIRPISAIDLFISVISLNVGVFLLRPVLENVAHFNDNDIIEILASRKRENVTMILNSLKIEKTV